MGIKHTYRIVLLVFVSVINISCKSSDKAAKANADNLAYENLLALIENKAFQIDLQSAEPFNTLATAQVINDIMIPQTGNNASRININADAHKFIMINDKVKGSMPFFGEMRMGSGHYGNSDGGININDTPDKFRILPNEKKKRVVVKFNVQDLNTNSENYNVTLTAFPNGNAQMVFVSTHRTLIRYNGLLKPLEADIE